MVSDSRFVKPERMTNDGAVLKRKKTLHLIPWGTDQVGLFRYFLGMLCGQLHSALITRYAWQVKGGEGFRSLLEN